MTNANKLPTQSGSQQDSLTRLLSVNTLALRLREQDTLLRPRQQRHSQNEETRRAFLVRTLSQALELAEEMMGDDRDY
jgi:hypothetical protein